MLVAHLEPPSPHLQGDHIYRTAQPCAALAHLAASPAVAEEIYLASGSWLSPWMHQAARSADLLVLCQSFDVDMLALVSARRRRGLATLLEINDNFMAPQAAHPAAAFYTQPHIRSLIVQLAGLVDGLQTCSPGLQSRFAHLGRRHCLRVNHLDAVPPRRAWRAGGATDKVVLGWAGSLGHRDDVAALVPALCDLLQRLPQLHLAVMAPQALHPLFAACPAGRLTLQPGGDLRAYRAFLQQIDIGLAPLLPTPFNACRSDVKYLEYSAAGAVTLASCQPGYVASVRHDHDGLLFADTAQLMAQVEQMVTHPQRRMALAAAAYTKVAEGRLEHHHAGTRAQWYTELVQQARAQAVDAPPLAPAAVRFAQLWGQASAPPCAAQRPAPRYIRGAFGQLETLLYASLSAPDAEGVALATKAQALSPAFYLPALYAGSRQNPAAAAQLSQAVRLAPTSAAAHLAQAHAALARGALQEAFLAFARAAQHAPALAPAHEGMARVALHGGQPQRAEAHLRTALRHNPAYRPAAARLAVVLRDRGALRDAAEVLQPEAHAGAGTWLEYFLLGDILRRQGQVQRARPYLHEALRQAPDNQLVRTTLQTLERPPGA